MGVWTHRAGLAMQLILVILSVFCIGLFSVGSVRELTRWKELELLFSLPAGVPVSGKKKRVVAIMVNGQILGGILKASCKKTGLFLFPIFPFSTIMPPIAIPWNKIGFTNQILYHYFYLLSIAGTDIVIGLSPYWYSYAKEIKAGKEEKRGQTRMLGPECRLDKAQYFLSEKGPDPTSVLRDLQRGL